MPRDLRSLGVGGVLVVLLGELVGDGGRGGGGFDTLGLFVLSGLAEEGAQVEGLAFRT